MPTFKLLLEIGAFHKLSLWTTNLYGILFSNTYSEYFLLKPQLFVQNYGGKHRSSFSRSTIQYCREFVDVMYDKIREP